MLRCPLREFPDAMTSTIEITRPARRWTYADYCRIPNDGKRHEILDGRHFVTPAPEVGHQRLSAQFFKQLQRQLEATERGEVLYAPVDVHLGPGTIVQPDLVVLRGRTRPDEDAKKIDGAPTLVVEILSPSTRRHDRERKRERYERAGVREYLIVDPETRSVDQFVLRSGRFLPPITSTTTVCLRSFRGLEIDLRKIW